MRMAGKAWRYWLLRFAADALFAVVVGLLAHAATGATLDSPLHGIAIALFSVSGLRSNTFDPGEDAVGLQDRFAEFRAYITDRIDNVVSVHASAEQQRARETMSQLNVEPEWVAERLRDFIGARAAFSEAEQAVELEGVDAHVGEDAVPDDDKLKVLLEDAMRVGGDELVSDILARARERRPPA